MKERRPRLLALLLILSIGALSVDAAEEPMTLKRGSWVCETPQRYSEALARQKSGGSVHALARELFDAKQCIYMDDDNLEDMMAPFVTVLDQDGDMTKVTFVVEHYKRITMLHRKFARMTYTGWTAASNVTSYY